MLYNLKKSQALFIVVLSAIVFIAHASYITNGFVWLDHGDIEGGRAVAELSDFKKIFFSRFGETGFYRPLVTITNSIDAALYGNWAPGYHTTNITLHILAAIAVYLLARLYFGLAPAASAIAATIFGVHPLSWLPVGAISYRPELLVTLFTLGALIIYCKHNAEPTKKNLIFFGLLAFIAFLSKETALFWIPGLVLLHHHLNGKSLRELPKKVFLILFIIIVLYGALRITSVPNLWGTESPEWGLNESIGTRVLAFENRLTELFLPTKPALADTIIQTSIIDWRVFATVAIVTALLLYAFSKKALAVERNAILFLMVALLPALNIIPLPRFNSPHYGYFAAIGIGIVFAALAGRNMFLKVVTAAWILIATGTTFIGGFQFSDDKTLFEPEVARVPEFLEGHYYLGNYYFDRGDIENASREYNAAYPSNLRSISYVDVPSLIINMAGIELSYKNYGAAKELLDQLDDVAPVSFKPLIAYNLALIEYKKGNYSAVINLLEPYRNSFARPEPARLLNEALRQLGANSN